MFGLYLARLFLFKLNKKTRSITCGKGTRTAFKLNIKGRVKQCIILAC